MYKPAIYSIVAVALIFCNLALAETKKVDDLTIEYTKRNLSPEQLDSQSAAQLKLSNNYEQLIDVKTTLEPGCAHMAAISTLQLNGQTLPLLCGNNGAGRNETLQVIGQLGSNRVITALNFGQMAAEVKSLNGANYFLTAQTNEKQVLRFKVYTLMMNDSLFGFVPIEDEQASNIYRNILANYQAAQTGSEQRVVETLLLIEQSRLQLTQQCDALKLLSDKAPADISQGVKIKLNALHEQACKGN